MTKSCSVALCALLLLGACGGELTDNEQILRIDCGETDVLVTRAQAEAFLAGTAATPEATARAVCDTFSGIDASTYTQPRDVTVTTANGAQVKGQVQASQQ